MLPHSPNGGEGIQFPQSLLIGSPQPQSSKPGQEGTFSGLKSRDVFGTQIDSTLVFAADQHLTHSAVPNLIQEALMSTRTGRNVEVRRNLAGEHARIEVENECGSPLSNTSDDPSGPLRTDGIPMDEPTDNSGPGLGRGFLYA